jgi:hypothetical protein
MLFRPGSGIGSNELGLRRSQNVNKLVAFNTVIRLFKAHKIFFPIEKESRITMAGCTTEFQLASGAGFKSKHDDFAHTISMMMNLQAGKPSEEAPIMQTKNEEGMWKLKERERHFDRRASHCCLNGN